MERDFDKIASNLYNVSIEKNANWLTTGIKYVKDFFRVGQKASRYGKEISVLPKGKMYNTFKFMRGHPKTTLAAGFGAGVGANKLFSKKEHGRMYY